MMKGMQHSLMQISQSRILISFHEVFYFYEIFFMKLCVAMKKIFHFNFGSLCYSFFVKQNYSHLGVIIYSLQLFFKKLKFKKSKILFKREFVE